MQDFQYRYATVRFLVGSGGQCNIANVYRSLKVADNGGAHCVFFLLYLSSSSSKIHDISVVGHIFIFW
jgi:hypothetical protein